MKRKPYHFIPLLGALFLVLTLLGSGCAELKEPEFREVSSFKMNNEKGKGLNFDVGVKIFNPNRRRISVVNYDLDVFINGVHLGEAKSKDKQTLKKFEEKEVRISVSTNIGKLLLGGLGMLTNLRKDSSAKIRIRGVVTGKAYGVKKRFSIDEEDVLGLNL